MNAKKISYKKLWKILVDRDMNKSDLVSVAGITSHTIAKMGRGEEISDENLKKLCFAFECNVEDICEIEEITGR